MSSLRKLVGRAMHGEFKSLYLSIERVVKEVDEEELIQGCTRRVLEESVELCLAAGLTPERVMGAVMDSITAQLIKSQDTKWPSQLKCEFTHLGVHQETVDVLVQVGNLLYIKERLNRDFDTYVGVSDKLNKLINTDLHVQLDGSFYSSK